MLSFLTFTAFPNLIFGIPWLFSIDGECFLKAFAESLNLELGDFFESDDFWLILF